MSTQARAASWRSVFAATAEPAVGGGGYIEILGEPRGGADHKPIISQGVVGVV